MLLDALQARARVILDVCQRATQQPQQDGRVTRPDAQVSGTCQSQSLDHAVMERVSNVFIFPFSWDLEWREQLERSGQVCSAKSARQTLRWRHVQRLPLALSKYLHSPGKKPSCIGLGSARLVDYWYLGYLISGLC